MAMNTEPSAPANRALNPLKVSENGRRILRALLAALADIDKLIRFAAGKFHRSLRIILAIVVQRGAAGTKGRARALSRAGSGARRSERPTTKIFATMKDFFRS